MFFLSSLICQASLCTSFLVSPPLYFSREHSFEESPPGSLAYLLHLYQIDIASASLKRIASTAQPDDTFVNLQWAELDARGRLLYLLLQDENEAIKMDSMYDTSAASSCLAAVI